MTTMEPYMYDKKLNTEYWDEIESVLFTAIACVKRKAINGEIHVDNDYMLDISKRTVDLITNELEAVGLVFPYVDQDM